jgi:uncharacterized protein YjeT (DUF2065 family)
MRLFLLGVGLVLALEGAAYALFPAFARNLMRQVADSDPARLRYGGVIALAAGVIFVWLAQLG